MRLSTAPPTPLWCALFVIAFGCGSDPSTQEHFLVGSWEGVEMQRSCTLSSAVDQKIVWDEVFDWDGAISVKGVSPSSLKPRVSTEYSQDGELQLTVGELDGDHLRVFGKSVAKLTLNNRTYEGPLNFVRDTGSITVDQTTLKGEKTEVQVQGTIKLPTLDLRKDVPMDVRLIPAARLAKLPPIDQVVFESNGRAILNQNRANIAAKWNAKQDRVSLELPENKNGPVVLKVQKETDNRISMTWKTRLNGEAIGAKEDTLLVKCKDTQVFEGKTPNSP